MERDNKMADGMIIYQNSNHLNAFLLLTEQILEIKIVFINLFPNETVYRHYKIPISSFVVQQQSFCHLSRTRELQRIILWVRFASFCS